MLEINAQKSRSKPARPEPRAIGRLAGCLGRGKTVRTGLRVRENSFFVLDLSGRRPGRNKLYLNDIKNKSAVFSPLSKPGPGASQLAAASLRLKQAQRKSLTVSGLPIRRSARRLIALLLIFMINWFGLSGLGATAAYFNDTESSNNNFFSAGALDFSLPLSADFAPVCVLPGESATRNVILSNQGNPYQYEAAAAGFSGPFCHELLLSADWKGGDPEYLGRLDEFRLGPFLAGDEEQWSFRLTVPADLPPDLDDLICDFNFTFTGSQIRHNLPLGAGFSDREVLANRLAAPVCRATFTRPWSYWQKYPEMYVSSLPQTLGAEQIETIQQVDAVWQASGHSAAAQLKKQLLAMKFNIARFAVGAYYIADKDLTIAELAAAADGLLAQDPPPADEVFSEMENVFAYWNADRSLRVCACATGGPEREKILINKVYARPDERHGSDPDNEWVELFNPNEAAVDITGWQIADNQSADTLSSSSPLIIGAKGYALMAVSSTTWEFWNRPLDVLLIEVEDGKLGGGLDNDGDLLILKDYSGRIIDQMNWGEANPAWTNYDQNIWNPGLATTSPGQMLGRVPSGQDTDTAADWQILSAPRVALLYPVGGEVWYVGHTATIRYQADNLNGEQDDSRLSINIYYSRDSGRTWGTVATGTPNTGLYHWPVPLFLESGRYYVPSPTARIRIVAVGPENFLVQDRSESADFCPPIDYDALDAETRILVDQLLRAGIIQPEEVIYGGLPEEENTEPEISAEELRDIPSAEGWSSADNGQNQEIAASVPSTEPDSEDPQMLEASADDEIIVEIINDDSADGGPTIISALPNADDLDAASPSAQISVWPFPDPAIGDEETGVQVILPGAENGLVDAPEVLPGANESGPADDEAAEQQAPDIGPSAEPEPATEPEPVIIPEGPAVSE